VINTTQHKVIETHKRYLENTDCECENYEQLFEEYKKLLKRYERLADLGDAYSATVQEKNDHLQTFTKKKIVENKSRENELKNEHQLQITAYQDEIASLHEQLKFLKATKNDIVKVKKENMVLVESNKKLKLKLKLLESTSDKFEELLKRAITQAHDNNKSLCLVMIAVNRFHNIVKKVESFSTSENFILGVHRYLKGSLHSIDTVIFMGEGKFAIILPSKDMSKVVPLLKVVTKSRQISGLDVSLSCCASELEPKDDFESITARVKEGFEKSLIKQDEGEIVVV
jgi:GGDEF domain-containing protein